MGDVAKYFQDLLPEELRGAATVDNTLVPRLRIFEQHLRTVYGRCCDWDATVRKVSEWDKAVDFPVKFRSCPVFYGQEVLALLAQDEADRRASDCVTALLEGRLGYGHDQSVMLLAGLLGFVPLAERGASLNERLVDWRRVSSRDVDYASHVRLFDAMVSCYAPLFVRGFVVEYPVVGDVCTQPRRRFYWRGENAFYPKSTASCYRVPFDDESTRALVTRLRLSEFSTAIRQLDAVGGWRWSSVNYKALAQHYGIRTDMMDLTADLRTALFFCGCKYERGEWKPLAKSDFEHRDSRPHISRGGGDSRYATLFRTHADLSDMRWLVQGDAGSTQGLVVPVGYQPFMRCSAQTGYMVEVPPGYDMKADPLYETICIKLSEDFTHWIWEEMGRGEDVYPNVDVPRIDWLAQTLNGRRSFDRNTLRDEYDEGELDRISRLLEPHGYTIEDRAACALAPDVAERINADYTLLDAERATGLDEGPRAAPLVHVR